MQMREVCIKWLCIAFPQPLSRNNSNMNSKISAEDNPELGQSRLLEASEAGSDWMGNTLVGKAGSKAWGGIEDYFEGARYDEFMIQHDTHVDIVDLPLKADIKEAINVATIEGLGTIVIPAAVSVAAAGLVMTFTYGAILSSINRAVDRWAELHPGEGRCPVYFYCLGDRFEFQAGNGCYYYHRYGTFECHPVMRSKQFRKYCKCHYTEDDNKEKERVKALLMKYPVSFPNPVGMPYVPYDLYYFG